MFNLLLISALFVSSLGHMCLLNPYQRPGFVNDTSLSTKGAGECALTSEPCGGVSAGFINAGIMSETYTVVMEKNLDHFNSAAPGNFTVNLWSSGGEFVRTLGSVMDDNRTSGSLYQVRFPVPHEGGESRFIIQTVYYTNNKNAPPAFYQCADMEIYPRN
mmetsp:Transcript_34827/g.30662  ORF Transcript_34827/g.30662 Transcript_34827/m.30662 type:complete len:160 (-) Transcript_34827:127-606(-)